MPRFSPRFVKRWNPNQATKRCLQQRFYCSLAPLYRFSFINNKNNKHYNIFKTQKKYQSSNTSSSPSPSSPSCRWIVGIDGTKFGYMALEQTFNLANPNDKIIGLHIPLDFQFVHIPLQYANIFEEHDEKSSYQKKIEEQTKQIESKVNELTSTINKNNNDFEFLVYDESVAPKHDLVQAVDKHNADYLVLGESGHSHSIREALEETLGRILGSVADYCVHHANCNVIIVKPKDD